MGERTTEQAFARFARTGDPAALASVFDATAPELLRIATHLTSDVHRAEDLVQETFAIAIEAAARYDPSRPLLSWLLGILANRARRHRRNEARTLDPTRLSAPPPGEPVAELERRELSSAVGDAIARLPEPLQPVLMLHLRHGLSPSEIALDLRRAPAAVRRQLARGLEQLRQMLPPGLAVGLTATALSGAGIAALRDSVLARATSSVSRTTMLFGGLTLLSKVALGAVLGTAALVSAAALARPYAKTAAPPLASTRTEAPLGQRSSAADPSLLRVAVRTRVADAKPSRAAQDPDPGPTLVRPWIARVRVVDAGGQPVTGADVIAYDGRKGPPSPFSVYPDGPPPYEYHGARRDAPPAARSRSSHDGRCALPLDREMVCIIASKDGAGTSRVFWRWHDGREWGDQEVLAILDPPFTLRGRVLDGDGSPVADADVTVRASNDSTVRPGRVEAPSPTRTDADGTFQYELELYASYEIDVRKDGREAYRARVTSTTPGERSVEIRFPGAFAVRGVVVDHEGKALAGVEVRADEIPEKALRDGAGGRARTNAEGAFDLHVRGPGRFVVHGAGGGLFAGPEPVEVADAQPQVDVALRMRRGETVSGIVRRSDGTPIGGARVELWPEGSKDVPDLPEAGGNGVATPYGVFGPRLQATTDEQGAFRFDGVHPGATHELRCTPHPERWPDVDVRRSGIAPGQRDVVVALDEGQLAGSVVRATVRDDATGKPIPEFRVMLVSYHEESLRAQELRGERIVHPQPGVFEIGRPLGARFGLCVHAAGYAGELYGPIVAQAPLHAIEIRLRRPGAIALRIIDADGRPVPFVRAHAWPSQSIPSLLVRGWSCSTDAEGRGRIEWLNPGMHHLAVHWQHTVVKRVVDVPAGDTVEIEIALPRVKRE